MTTKPVTDDTRVVSAAVFAAWWDRLSDLFERHPQDASVGRLLNRLAEAGRESGATRSPDDDRSPTDSRPAQTIRNDSFDWEHGDVVIGPTLINGRVVGADQFIAELSLATGVPRGTQPSRQ
jgi:hypothetical protein